jgi:formate-dependent nitrite reductase membrane component NrfD
MIQDKPYEFMVKYTPQREWIEERGLLIWLSSFFVEVGAATFMIASISGNLWAMLVGLVMCAIPGGGLHLADLGRPLRFWRILFSSSWKSSWIARGIWFVSLFIFFGGLYVALAFSSLDAPFLLPIAFAFAFCTIVYFGFLLSYVKGLALWNSSLLPLLILVISIWGGLNVHMLTSLITDTVSVPLEFLSQPFPLLVVFMLFFYLAGIRYQGRGGRVSFGEIVRGKWAPLFWIGVVFCGVVFPVAVGWLGMPAMNLSKLLLFISLFLQLGANLSLRYCIFKCAMYEPVIPALN